MRPIYGCPDYAYSYIAKIFHNFHTAISHLFKLLILYGLCLLYFFN